MPQEVQLFILLLWSKGYWPVQMKSIHKGITIDLGGERMDRRVFALVLC